MPYRAKPSFPQLNRSHPLAQGLVLDLPFSSGSGLFATDVSGREKHGTFVGTPSWQAGQLGTQLNLNGSSQYVTMTNPLTRTAGQGLTFMCIVAFTDGGAGSYNLLNIRNGDSGSGNWTAMRIGSGTIVWLHDYFGAASSAFVQSSAINDGLAHVIIGTYNGTTLDLYVDGKKNGTSATYSSAVLSATGGWAIGRRSDFDSEYYPGKLILARVYSRGLSPQEVASVSADPFQIYKKNTWFLGAAAAATPATVNNTGSIGLNNLSNLNALTLNRIIHR